MLFRICYAIPRYTLANGNKKRDWRIYKEFANTRILPQQPFKAINNLILAFSLLVIFV